MATLLFYKNPIPLNTGLHRETRLQVRPGDFRFAARTNAVPLAAVEFFDAAREYPVVFAPQESGVVFPVAMVGARNEENLFVDAGGRWDARYVPAFARRYPFVLAETPSAGDLKVFVDQAYDGFGAEGGERLFSPEGEPTPILDQALSFLRTYQGEIRRTREFVERLSALDLLVPRVLDIAMPGHAPLKVQGFSTVDEQKLNTLTDQQLLGLARSGFLAWIHAHLWSLGNVTRFADRLMSRAERPGDPAPLQQIETSPVARVPSEPNAAGLDLEPAPAGMAPDKSPKPSGSATAEPRRGPTRRRS